MQNTSKRVKFLELITQQRSNVLTRLSINSSTNEKDIDFYQQLPVRAICVQSNQKVRV